MAVAQTKLPSEFQLRVYKLCFAIPRGKVRRFFPRFFAAKTRWILTAIFGLRLRRTARSQSS